MPAAGAKLVARQGNSLWLVDETCCGGTCFALRSTAPPPTGGCERGGPTCRPPALPSKGGREGTPSSGYCYSPLASAGGRRRGGRRRPAGSSPSLGSIACNWSPLMRPVPKSSIANASSSMTSRALWGNCA